jgi:hypothetical protein
MWRVSASNAALQIAVSLNLEQGCISLLLRKLAMLVATPGQLRSESFSLGASTRRDETRRDETRRSLHGEEKHASVCVERARDPCLTTQLCSACDLG